MIKQLILLASVVSFTAIAQDRRPTTPTTPSTPPAAATPAPSAPKPGPKPYKSVITDKSKTSKGLFLVLKVEEKYFFELPVSLLGREMMALTRLVQSSTTPGSVGFLAYGGDFLNRQAVRVEKGPIKKIFMRSWAFVTCMEDAILPI